MTHDTRRPHIGEPLSDLGAQTFNIRVVEVRVQSKRLILHEHAQVCRLAAQMRAVYGVGLDAAQDVRMHGRQFWQGSYQRLNGHVPMVEKLECTVHGM